MHELNTFDFLPVIITFYFNINIVVLSSDSHLNSLFKIFMKLLHVKIFVEEISPWKKVLLSAMHISHPNIVMDYSMSVNSIIFRNKITENKSSDFLNDGNISLLLDFRFFVLSHWSSTSSIILNLYYLVASH